MTPAEALAKALRAAPNVTGRVARLFADATPTEAARVAANLADMIQQMTGETWLPEDVTALAEGITARPPIGSVRIDPASLPGGDGASLATQLAAAQHALASMRRELRAATKDLEGEREALATARTEIAHLTSDRDSRAVDVAYLRARLTAVRDALHAARADRDAVATRLTVVEDMHRQHMEVCPTRDDHEAARRNAAEVDRLHTLIDRILDGSAYTHAQQAEWRREARP